MKTEGTDPLSRVVLVIATFRADEEVIQCLRDVDGLGFAKIIVVDSLGSTLVPQAISDHEWTVEYISANHNLGSAGNLTLRLQAAAETSAEFAYAVNHDGTVCPDTVRALVAVADQVSSLGAVFPRRRYVNRGGQIRAHGRRSLLHRTADREEYAAKQYEEVAWSSSNGALYALGPIRAGVEPPAHFWMGWEDLAYGCFLRRAGYRQVVANNVIVDDPYEYKNYELAGRTIHITEKPSWYQYYTVRNLLLLAKQDTSAAPMVVERLIAELGLVLTLRPRKVERLRLFGIGLAHGLLGRAGKWTVP